MQERNVNPIYTQWLAGLDEEILFWAKWISTGGSQWPQEFQTRMQQIFIEDSKEVDRSFVQKISQMPSQDIKILDVGSGPLTVIGRHKEKNLQVTACDPLADAYNDLMEKYGVEPPVRPVFADCENLSLFFEHNYFDVVYCRNALDHSYNPLQGILQMSQVVKPGGMIYLIHAKNEAVNESYRGLHQWNFCEENGDMIVWNQKNERYSIRNFLGEDASVETNVRINKNSGYQKIVCRIHPLKHSEMLRSKINYDLHHKYKILMEELLASKTEQILKRENLEE